MSFDTHGFLSPKLEKYRASLRAKPTYAAWFQFGEDLNHLGIEMLQELVVPLSDYQKVTLSGLFVRAHKSLQSALLLTEMGLVGDARAVLRSAVEGAIALNALAAEPRFLDQLIEAHHFQQRKKHGWCWVIPIIGPVTRRKRLPRWKPPSKPWIQWKMTRVGTGGRSLMSHGRT